MSETLKNNEFGGEDEVRSTLETAENILALLENDESHSDQIVAGFVEETGEAFDSGAASFEEAVIADEVGLLKALETHEEAKETIDALARHNREPYGIAVGVIDGVAEDEAFAAVIERVDEVAKSIRREYGEQEATGFESIATQESSVEYVAPFHEDAPSDQAVERQIRAIETAVEANDMDVLRAYLERGPAVVLGKAALTTLIAAVGEASFKADTWSGGEEEKVLSDIAQLIGLKVSLLPKHEQPEVFEEIVTHGGGQILVNRVIAGHIDQRQVGDLLYRHKNFIKLASHINLFSDIDPNDLIEGLVENNETFMVTQMMRNAERTVDVKRVEAILYEHAPDLLAYEKELFPDIDDDKLVRALYENDSAYVVASNVLKFPHIDRTELALACIDQRSGWILGNNPAILAGLELGPIEERLREAGNFEVFLKQRELFPGIEINEIVDGLLENRRASELVEAIGEASEVTAESVYQRIIDSKQSWAIVEGLQKFPHADVELVMRNAVDEGSAWAVVGSIKALEGVPAQLDMMNYIVEVGQGFQLVDHRESVEQSDDELADMFLAHGRYAQLISSVDKLKDLDMSRFNQHLVEVLGKDDVVMSERDFGALNEYITANVAKAEQPDELKLTNRYMGLSGATAAGYRIVRDLHAGGEVSPEARQLGVTKPGVKGLEQFGVMAGQVARELMDADMSDEVLGRIAGSDLYQGILQKVYRVDLAEFGDTTNEGIDKLLGYFQQAQAEGRVAPLDGEHYVRHTTEIAALGAPTEKISLTDDAKTRYETLRDDIHSAVNVLEGEHPFETLLVELGQKIVGEIESLERDINDLGEGDPGDRAFEFKQKNLNLKRETLKGLIESAREGAYVGESNFAMRSPDDLSTVFNQLEPFSGLHDDMRQLVFAWALRDKPQQIERMKELATEPSIQDMGAVRSFVEQIVNNETFGNYFEDKKTATKFKKLTSVRSLDEALVRHQQEAKTTGQHVLSITPTRGFAMELSGHVGDACWASKYDSMAEQFPHMTSLIFKRGEDGSQNERLVGSAMLIETKDEQGNDVLLLRGVNPIENFINKVRVEDFYRIATEYCRDVAKSKGMKPAVVIDTDAGRAGTNRPVLHEFMTRMRDAGMENVIVDDASSKFNGYDVTRVSYAL